MRIRFCLPAVRHPVGGNFVALRIQAVLRERGFDALPICGERGYSDPYMVTAGPFLYDGRLTDLSDPPGPAAKLFRRGWGWLHRRGMVADTVPIFAAPERVFAAEDVVVLPEYAYARLAPRFAECRKVVLVQDVHGLVQAYLRDGGRVLDGVERVICTSDASEAAVRAVYRGDIRRLSMAVGRAGMAYTEAKKPQIAYMARKRPQEAGFAAAALARCPEARDMRIVELANLSEDALAAALRESLFFLSLSRQEGFGLPAAEAMLCGCIVVGYAGVGGREYMTEETALIVPDSDIIGLVETVRGALAEYGRDPAPLDAMRRAASARIAGRYCAERFRSTAIAAFEGL